MSVRLTDRDSHQRLALAASPARAQHLLPLRRPRREARWATSTVETPCGTDQKMNMSDNVAGARSPRDRRATWEPVAALLPVMMSAAAIVLGGWVWYGRYAAQRPEPPTVPATPQSLAGAELTGNHQARAVLIQYSDF